MSIEKGDKSVGVVRKTQSDEMYFANLESRIALDAAAGGELIDAVDGGEIDISAEMDVTAPVPAPDSSFSLVQMLIDEGSDGATSDFSTSVAFFDSSLPDLEGLIAQVPAGAEWYVVDALDDGLKQISDAVEGRSGFTDIYVVSQGTPGSLMLGSGVVDIASMSTSQSGYLAEIDAALIDGGSLHIYGADFDGGEAGQAASQLLSQMTSSIVQVNPYLDEFAFEIADDQAPNELLEGGGETGFMQEEPFGGQVSIGELDGDVFGIEIFDPEGPSDEGPVDEGPTDEGPVDEGPVNEGPSFEGPGGDGSGFQGPGFEGPGFEGPGGDGSGFQGPGFEGPGFEGPGGDGPPMGPGDGLTHQFSYGDLGLPTDGSVVAIVITQLPADDILILNNFPVSVGEQIPLSMIPQLTLVTFSEAWSPIGTIGFSTMTPDGAVTPASFSYASLPQTNPDEASPDESGPDEVNPDETNPDETSPDGINPDEASPDQPGPEQPGPDEISPDETSPDETSPDGRNPDETSPDETSPDGRNPDETSPDETNPDETSPDETNPDGRNPDGTNPDGSNPDGLDPKSPDGTNPDDTNPDGRNPDGRNPDGQNPDGQNPDGFIPDWLKPSEPDPRIPDGFNPDGTNPDGTNPDDTNPDGLDPDGRNPDGRNPDGFIPDWLKPGEPDPRIPDGFTPDKSDPDGTNPDQSGPDVPDLGFPDGFNPDDRGDGSNGFPSFPDLGGGFGDGFGQFQIEYSFTADDFGQIMPDGEEIASLVITRIPDVPVLIYNGLPATPGSPLPPSAIGRIGIAVPPTSIDSDASFDYEITSATGVRYSATILLSDYADFSDIETKEGPPTQQDIEDILGQFHVRQLMSEHFAPYLEDGQELRLVEITSLPSSGLLLYRAQPVTVGTVIAVETMSELIYNGPAGNSDLSVGFGFRATTHDGVLAEDFFVIADIPDNHDADETGYRFVPADFGLTGDNLEGKTIVFDSLPPLGTLSYNDEPIEIGTEIPATEVQNISYLTERGSGGIGKFLFQYRVVGEGESGDPFDMNLDVDLVSTIPFFNRIGAQAMIGPIIFEYGIDRNFEAEIISIDTTDAMVFSRFNIRGEKIPVVVGDQLEADDFLAVSGDVVGQIAVNDPIVLVVKITEPDGTTRNITIELAAIGLPDNLNGLFQSEEVVDDNGRNQLDRFVDNKQIETQGDKIGVGQSLHQIFKEFVSFAQDEAERAPAFVEEQSASAPTENAFQYSSAVANIIGEQAKPVSEITIARETSTGAVKDETSSEDDSSVVMQSFKSEGSVYLSLVDVLLGDEGGGFELETTDGSALPDWIEQTNGFLFKISPNTEATESIKLTITRAAVDGGEASTVQVEINPQTGEVSVLEETSEIAAEPDGLVETAS